MNKWADLGVRSASALVLAPFVLTAVWFGGDWFLLLVLLMGIMMAQEWVTIVHNSNAFQFLLHIMAVVAAVIFAGTTAQFYVISCAIATSILLVLLSNEPKSIWKLIGVPYVALPILALILLRDDPQWGLFAILWCMAIVWAADILAYFAGRIIGGPRLAPRLSPKKTWAGLGGAVVGAGAASAMFAASLGLSYWPLVALAAFFAILEQGGDIAESALKRFHGVKDSGTLIPGHGGILDRVDGLTTVVLVAGLVGISHNSMSAADGLLRW
jgi:phosphatidate cytidylyltransferase